MAVPGSINELLIGAANAGAGGYEIERSLRFNTDDSAYLSRDFPDTGSRTTFTISAWFKRVDLPSSQYIFVGGSGTNSYLMLDGNQLRFLLDGGATGQLKTNAIYRDVSAWMHVIVVGDSTNATSSDRLRMYVNGERITSFATEVQPTQDANLGDFNTASVHYFNRLTSGNYGNIYLADCIFLDGTAATAGDFGEFDDNGVWQPIEVDASLISGSITEGTGALSLYNLGNTFDSKASPATFRTDPYASNLQTAVAGDSSNEVSYLIRGSGSALTLTNTDVTFNQTGKYYSDAYLIQNAGAACEVAETSGNKPGTSDFCVEFWINPTTTPTNAGLFSYGDYDTAGSFGIMTTGSNSIRVDMHDGVTSGSRLSVAGGLQANEWQHFALTRSGTICTLYRNGTSQGSWLIAAGADFTPASNPRYVIGNRLGLGFGSYNITSYFQDFRVYVGTEKYSGDFTLSTQTGANGFHLPFSDNSTAAALGTDTSGNGNDWTVNNISVTAGADNDSLFDSPQNGTQTDTGAGGEVSGNYCTWNPLCVTTNNTLTNGNLEAAHTAGTGWTGNPNGTDYAMFVGTIGVTSGKWYWEGTWTSATTGVVGIVNVGAGLVYYPGYDPKSVGYSSTYVYNDGFGSPIASMPSYAQNDIIGVAIDMDSGKLYFSVNGAFINSGDPVAGTGNVASGMTGETIFPAVSQLNGSDGVSFTANFGQRAFAYSAPSGYKALCTANLDDPTIADGSTEMDVVLYNANGSTQTISGLGFSPDLVWSKSRNRAYSHGLHDSVRGAYKYLRSNGTNTETDTSGDPATYTLTSFDADGFSVGQDGGAGVINNNAAGATTYVAWTWDAGTSTVTNNDGSITSSVRANPTAGFSIVSYTGTGANATVGHGLNAAPEFIIVKNRDGTQNWQIYHSALGATKYFNFTTASVYTNSNRWQDTEPTSSVFSIGNAPGLNTLNNENIAYCFAPVEGYSAFGSYTGNGSADGPFVYTGFRPRFLLYKYSSTTGNWAMFDSERNTYNVMDNYLLANTSDAEASLSAIDFLSNGFKVRTAQTSGATVIYAAFAENPFKTARAR